MGAAKRRKGPTVRTTRTARKTAATPPRTKPGVKPPATATQASQGQKIRRLLKLLSLLRSSVSLGPKELAQQLGVQPRQITRDLSEWQRIGVTISYNRAAKRYDVKGGNFMPPLELETEEAMALVLLAEEVVGKRQIDFLGPAGTAIAKVVAGLPEAVRQELEQSRGDVQIRATIGGEEQGDDVYRTMREAVRQKRTVVCRYDSASVMQGQQAAAEFIFEPYTLLFHLRGWYVVGFNRLKQALRLYKLTRFRSAVITADRFEVPADFSLDGYLGNAWRIMSDPTTHRIELCFSADIAPMMTETRWHKTEETQQNEDGSVTYRFIIDGLTEIAWWILSYGPMVKVIRPIALAELVAKHARQTAAQYASTT